MALYVNTNQFYMQGFSGVVDVMIENLTSDSIDSVEIEVSGRLIAKKMFEAHRGVSRTLVERLSGSLLTKRISGPVVTVLSTFIKYLCGSLIAKGLHQNFSLGPGQCSQRLFQIDEPKIGGIQLIHFKITARQGTSVSAYRAGTTLLVLDKVESAKDIQIRADNFLNFGQASEKFNIGGVINVDIADKIKDGGIRTANDFMKEYENLPPAYKRLNLEPYLPSHFRWRPLAATALVLVTLAFLMDLWPDRPPRQQQEEVAPTTRQLGQPSEEQRQFERNQESVTGELEQVSNIAKKTEPTDSNESMAAGIKTETFVKPEEEQGRVASTKPVPIVKRSEPMIEAEETEGDVNEPEREDIIKRKEEPIKPEDTKGQIRKTRY
ncbi:hypothetical protein ACFL5F_04755 [Planctomycetota bacterium]